MQDEDEQDEKEEEEEPPEDQEDEQKVWPPSDGPPALATCYKSEKMW